MALVAALALIAAPTLAGSAEHGIAAPTCESELKGVLSCVDVFRKGEPAPGRVTPNNNWRIPGLLWADGVLFAFVEQYTRDCHPEWNPFKAIAMKRSNTGGQSFSNVSIVANPKTLWDEADNSSLWDPTPTYDAHTKQIFLAFSRMHGRPGLGLPHCTHGESGCRDLWMMRSGDMGESFGDLTNVTARIGWPALGSGISLTAAGGSGIQLPSGRLVVPVYSGHTDTVIPSDPSRVGSAVLLSDDHGKNWRLSQSVGDHRLCEGVVAQTFTGDDHIVFNMRLQDDNATDLMTGCGPAVRHCRAQSYSTNGGESWSRRVEVGALPDPQIKGGISRWPAQKSLVFANAAGLEHVNSHLTIYTSPDNGVTWPKSKLLYSGGTGYTVVQVLGDEDTAAVFFDRDGKCGVAMTLARVDLKTL